VRQGGECCCPRGADCGRPGKHPRSVHAGPGPHDYSWKPLACHTHAEIDQRFAPGGPYAAGNLMVAIPAGMMAIDIDHDDGGRAATAGLADELGELPPTLAHRTPHGEHLIYRTPAGWTGRAWVGKDPANPVPAGIDLRMPGQILMAAPSVVPGPDGPARYGPVTGGPVADLPAAYVTAWTPPAPQPRPARPRVPIPPDSADRAARYVHEAMTRIAEDLASRQPGGRNAAAYAAGLKAGSLLGAARATPGAEHAAAWTDEEAEEALLDAAERNGYTGKDGQAEARRAIRSGLRNGLRTPRALPDFTTPSPAPERQHPPARPAPSASARPPRSQAAAGSRAGRWQDMVPDGIRREIEAADTAARNRRRAAVAAHQQALDRHDRSATAQAAADVERTRAAADAAHQAYTHDGRHMTGRHDAAMLRWAAAIAAQREQGATQPGPGPDGSARARANRAAVAANEAYRAGDLDRARQLVDQAAAADPSRAGLWQQHRQQIAARRLIHSARAAHADGDHQRARKLLEDARQLDPRMPAIWDGDLPSLPSVRPGPPAGSRDVTAPDLGGTPVSGRSPAPESGRGDHVPAAIAHASQDPARPSWPASPARREPQHPGPDTPGPADTIQSSPPRPAAAAPREPRAGPAGIGQDADTSAGPDSDPAGRWPAPGPRAARQAGQPGQQARHEAAAGRHPGRNTQVSLAPETEPGRTETADPATASADWRDEVLSQARQSWQPVPSWPGNPALARPPESGNPGAEAELSEPDLSID